jgi:ribosomal protein S18 acetylase RimI-like enzyme
MVTQKISPTFRRARVSDAEDIIQIENASFTSDRMSKRSFIGFVKSRSANLIVMLVDQQIIGYGLVLYKKGSSLARLYSIAVSKKFSGKGLGKKLLMQLEKNAIQHNAGYMRLEVSATNSKAIGLYLDCGYYEFNVKKDYYEDHGDAICCEKKLVTLNPKKKTIKLSYYQQTTEFTCGAASLMMAMNALRPSSKPNQSLELQIWREATTIFMMRGHGGCGPQGLALAAAKRNFKVDIFLSQSQYFFLDTVRSEHKREIIKTVQHDFEKELRRFKIRKQKKQISFDLIESIIKKRGVPIILISSFMLAGEKTPHWVTISGIDDKFVYFNDPDLNDGHKTLENQDIPVRRDEFNRMSRYGGQQLQALLAIYKS